jgi:hypothetical protein
MPATNPVVAAVVPKETAAVIKRLARLQGRSQSAVMRDFLVELTPVLSRVAGLIELAQKAQGDWPRELIEKMESAQSELEQTALAAMSQLDTVAADAQAHSKGAGRRRRPNQPPSSNRGVKP